MGDRNSIVIADSADSGVCIYSHWGGYRLPGTLRRHLAAVGFNDPSYFTARLLTRAIAESVFDENTEARGFDLVPTAGSPASFDLETTEARSAARSILSQFADWASWGIGTRVSDGEYPVIGVVADWPGWSPENARLAVWDDYDEACGTPVSQLLAEVEPDWSLPVTEFITSGIETHDDLRRLRRPVGLEVVR